MRGRGGSSNITHSRFGHYFCSKLCIWIRSQGSQECQKIRILFLHMKVLSFWLKNIKNRVFRFLGLGFWGFIFLCATVRKNCSSDQEKLLKFEAESQEFAIILRSLEQFIQTVKGQNNFW